MLITQKGMGIQNFKEGQCGEFHSRTPQKIDFYWHIMSCQSHTPNSIKQFLFWKSRPNTTHLIPCTWELKNKYWIKITLFKTRHRPPQWERATMANCKRVWSNHKKPSWPLIFNQMFGLLYRLNTKRKLWYKIMAINSSQAQVAD